MIKAENLTKSYPNHGVVVDRLSLEVKEGEALVIVGRSGCGKSTILKMINGLVVPESGTVTVFGRPLNFSRIHETRRKIGHVCF